MKRLSKLIPLAASLLLLTSCGWPPGSGGNPTDTTAADTADTASVDTSDPVDTSDTTDTTDTTDTSDATDTTDSTDPDSGEQNFVEYYRPRFENHLYSFAGEGNEFAGYTSYPQYTQGQYTQFSTNNGGTITVTIVQYTQNEIREVFTRNETYFRENFISRWDKLESDAPQEILLQAPLEVGHSWESPIGSVSEITDLKARVDIPFGSFDAVEVTQTQDDYTTRYYYVHEVSVIKGELVNQDGLVVTSELESITEEPEVQTIQVHYPDEQLDRLDTTLMQLSFQTNDITRRSLADALKDIPEYAGSGLLGPNVSINWLYLNQDGRVYVDFSPELITEMNAGAGVESLILQGIVNTIGTYYGVEEVYLTVEGESYESGHISMEKGEFMTVDHSIVNH